MGVVYSHFASKEDLLLACAIELTRKKQSLVRLIDRYDMVPLRQLALLCVLMWEHNAKHPGLYELMPMACLPSVWKRASAARVNDLNQVGAETQQMLVPRFSALLEQVGQKAEQGKSLMCGMMSLVIGMWDIQNSGFGLIDVRIEDMSGENPFIENINNFFSGWGLPLQMDEASWQELRGIAGEIIDESDAQWWV